MKNKVFAIGMTAVVIVATIAITTLGASNLRKYNDTPSKETLEPLTVSQSQSSEAFNISQISKLSAEAQKANIQNGVQEITTELEPYGYPALTVQKGILVKWIINVDTQILNSCNNEIVIPTLGISKELSVGENIIEFTPSDTGVIQYSCWMGMINSTIAVVDDINNYDANEIQKQIDGLPPRGGCCG